MKIKEICPKSFRVTIQQLRNGIVEKGIKSKSILVYETSVEEVYQVCLSAIKKETSKGGKL